MARARWTVLATAMALGLGTAAQPAAGQDVTLTIHHFLGPTSITHARFIEPWAEAVTDASGGRIAFEIFPAMALGGRPPDLFQQVRDGVVDIVWTLPGYTPGVFPRVEVFELPNVHRGSATATNLAIQDIYADWIAPDFTDVHPILVHVHGGNALHVIDQPVAAIEDLDGMAIRVPTRTGAWMIEAWGADPVGMPVPELPQALSRGVVEAALIPFEVAVPLQIPSLTDVHVERTDGVRFGTSTFLFAMNRDRYDALPDDLRAILDARSGPAIAQEIGRVWDTFEPQAMALAAESGTVTRLSAQADAAFDAAAVAVAERWVAEMAADGIDGAGLVAAAQAAVARHSAE